MTQKTHNTAIERIKSHLDQLAEICPAVKEHEDTAGALWTDIRQELEHLSAKINRQDVMTTAVAQEAEYEQLLAETTTLYENSKAIASARNEGELFDAIFEQIRRQNPCEISIFQFHLVNNEPVWAELRANWQKRNNPSYPVGTRFYSEETPQVKLLASEEPLFVDDIATDPRLSDAEKISFAPTGACSVAVLPLATPGEELGAILVYFTQPHTFTETTQRLWLGLVDQICVGLANHRLIKEASYHITQMETAADIAHAATSILDLESLLTSTVELIRDRFDLYYVGVFLVDEAREWAVLRAGTGEAGRRQLAKGHRLKIGGESMIGWSIHHQEPRIALDVGKEAVHFQNPDLPDTHSEMALPLLHSDEVIGALTIQSVEQAAFSQQDILFLQIMADQLANAIQNARLFEETQASLKERQRAEKALRTSEAKYRQLVQTANSIILRLDTEGRVTFVNEFAQEFFGYTEEEILGLHAVGTIVPETDTAGRDLTTMIEDILQHPDPYAHNENENMRKNGERVWVVWTNKGIVDDKGNLVEILCIGNDVTKRKQIEAELRESEKRYRDLFENANDIIYTHDLEGNFTSINRVVERITGYTRDEALQLNIRQVVAPEYTDLVQEMFNRKIAEGGHTRYELEIIAKERRRVALEVSTRPIYKDGKAVGIQGIARDITQRKEAEEALQESLTRTQLLYNISEALATLTDRQAAFETVLGEYILLLGLERGGLMLLDQRSEYNRIEALYIDNKVIRPDLAFPVEEDLVAQYLLEHPFPLVIEDVHTHELTKHNKDIRGDVEAMLLVPLITKGEVIGILGADATEKGHVFSKDDIEIGEAIADQLTIWLENSQLLEEAQHRSNLLQTAAGVSKAASSILDANELISRSVNLIRDQFDFYYVGLFLVDEARKWAVLQAGTGEAGRIQLEKGHRLKIGGESMIGWSVEHRQARIALDVGEDAIHFQNPDLPDTHSEMALPLISRDEVIGALTVQSVARGAFSDEDITLLQTMADQLANAIANARLFENVTHAQQTAETLLQETQALQQLSQALAGTLRVHEVLDLFFQACTQEIGFEYVQFSLVDKYQNRVKAIAGIGLPESQIKRANRSLESDDIMVDIIKTGRTEIITGWDDRFHRETYEAEGHADWVRVFTPITLRHENIGLIEAGFNKNTTAAIKDSQIRLMRAFIDQTALALDNAQRYEASQKAAQREALIKEIIAKVRASTDLETILQTTVKEVGDAIDGKRSYVHLVSPTNGDAKDQE